MLKRLSVQIYTRGDSCNLGGDKETARTAEVRIACSPDSQQHLVMREPEQCQYIIVMYDPGVCELIELDLEQHELSAAELGSYREGIDRAEL